MFLKRTQNRGVLKCEETGPDLNRRFYQKKHNLIVERKPKVLSQKDI
jgi:hypothetical protein